MDYDATSVRSKKIQIYPTVEQAIILRAWLTASRFVYNETVARLKEHVGNTPSWMGDFGKEILNTLPEHVESAPYQIKKIAIRDALASMKEAKKRVAQKIIPRFKQYFRSRKNPVQSCYIPASALRAEGIYPTFTGGKIKMSEDIGEGALDSRLIHHRGKWYLSVPRKIQPHVAENQGRVVAIDPGVRNFVTLFSEMVFGHIGHGDIGKISKLCTVLDRLVSRKGASFKRAADRMRGRITHLVDELHWKCVKFLVTNFDMILLPHFETSEMVVRKSRKIRSKTVRSMLTLSHYKFAQRLLAKAWEYGKTVVRVSEAYTSKTNPWTGEVNHKLGGAKTVLVYGVAVDRDFCGARGTFLRALRDTSLESIGLFASKDR